MRPLAIELAFDDASSKRLTRLWTRAARLHDGRPTSELGVRPHVTLALFTEDEPSDPVATVAALAAALGPFDLDLAIIDRFPTDEGVIFLRPDPSPALAHAHALAHDVLGDDRDRVHAYYRLGGWHPHCTMAINVPEARVEPVFAACRAEGLGTVRITRVQLVRYRPATELAVFALQGVAAR